MSSVRHNFYKHLAQTSSSPLGLEVARADGLYVYDTVGRPFLDLISGICVSALGHLHPRVVHAIHKQLSYYQHVMVYGECILAPQTELAASLARGLPEALSVTYFTNSGSEAVEGALKLAKRYTGRSICIAFENAYHGSTHAALSLSSVEAIKGPFRPLLPQIKHLPFGDTEALSEIDDRCAAVIIEPIQGEAGVRIPSKSYMKALRARTQAVGAELIFDEIQTGWGRCGTFWAFEDFEIVPDILLTAKAMGGGMPLGAFISSPERMNCLQSHPTLGHITTFGGNPVCCAASLASLRVIEEENLHLQAEAKGEALAKALSDPLIDMRRKGLMMALQLPSEDMAEQLRRAALEEGLLLDAFLFCPSALRVAPPLIIEEQDIWYAAERFHRALKRVKSCLK